MQVPPRTGAPADEPVAGAPHEDARLRYLTLATGDAAYDWDARTGHVWRSRGSQALGENDPVGASPVWLGAPIHPDDRPRVMEDLERALHARQLRWTAEYRIEEPIGRDAVVVNRACLVYDGSGQLARMVGAITDVTERARTEQVLRLSEARYRALVNASSHAVGQHDPTRDAADPDWIRWWQELTGQPRTAATGYDWLRALHPDDRDRVRRLWTTHQDAGTLFDVEYRVLSRAGEYRHLHVRAVPVRDSGGTIREWISMFTDVTEQRRAERTLRESEERFRRIFESRMVGFLFSDPTGRISDANDTFLDMIGYTRDDLRSGRLNWKDLTPAEQAPLNDRALAEVAEKGVCTPFEKEYIRKDGSRVPVLLGAAGLTGTTDQGVAFVLDLTQRKRLEDELRQAQKMEAIGRLAGGVAHDFNNLLTVITGGAELALASLGARDDLAGLLTEIQAAGSQAARLTGQLLAFSRKAVVRPTVLDLNAAVADAEKMLRRLVEESIEITLTLDPEPWHVKADRTQIDQIILNLAVNARRAMPNGGSLRLETRNVTIAANGVSPPDTLPPGQYVRLTVTDTGVGMDEQTRARVFEPFFTTRRAGEGTGLGLAVVYGIVQQFSGHIDVESAPGKGAAFRIYLPRCQDEAGEETSACADAPVPKGQETLLIVEDDAGVRTLARTILTRQGYTVLEAKDGPEAIEVCGAHAGVIDLLLTDVVMPRMSGIELANHVKPIRPGMQAVFMSGYIEYARGPDARRAEDIDFLQKPFTPAALAGKIREVLDRTAKAAHRRRSPPPQPR